MRRILICMVLLSGIGVAAAQTAHNTKPLDIRDLMSVTQFHQSGLDKLSPQELTAFNAWFNDYLRQARQTANDIQVPAALSVVVPQAADARFGKEQLPEQGAKQIESRIAGVLQGWTGNTLFKLENGQVWKQAGSGYVTDLRLDHPRVIIKKLAFGYLLTLPGQSETVFVRRIR